MTKPMWLKKSKRDQSYVPILFDLQNKQQLLKLKKLLKKRKVNEVIDEYEQQLEELFKIENPRIAFSSNYKIHLNNYKQDLQKKTPFWLQGTWVYYPWSKNLVHVLVHKDFFKVRTARNRNLITEIEQQKFYDAVVGVAGQSVGSSVVLALVLEGGARRIKIADFDNLELSNTNRINAGTDLLGLPKVVITARKVYEVNPYAHVDIYTDGIHEKNVHNFFTKGDKLDVMVDEVDNMAVKLLLRETAKKMRVPVVMATDNGENGLVDIERYDKRPSPKFFHGRLGKVTRASLARLTKIEIGRMAGQYVGIENIPPRMIESLKEVGHSLASWPQLGGAALLNGVAVAYVIRRMVNNQSVTNNRGHVEIDQPLTPELKSKKSQNQAEKVRQAFIRSMFES